MNLSYFFFKKNLHFTYTDSQAAVFILERNALLCHLEEILSFNLIYRMMGIDPGITEKSGSKYRYRNSGPPEHRVGMADRRNGGPIHFRKRSAIPNNGI